MAKSNLKLINLNFITQYSNSTADSKFSYSYYSHFYIYYNFLLVSLSTNLNFLIFKTHKSSQYNSIKVNKNFFELTQFHGNLINSNKLNFELDLNVTHQNNKFLIIHNIFLFKNSKLVKFNNNVIFNKKELVNLCLTKFEKCSIVFPKYLNI